jgi:serine/threonine protein kinase
VLKISDFGFCKPATERGSFSVSRNGTGTVHFIAPELLTTGDNNPRGTIACDVFSLGCVFYRFLTMGKHPFSTGDDLAINMNIREGNHSLDGENLSFLCGFTANFYSVHSLLIKD